MVGRILIEAAPARVLISKAGHEVTDPSLPEDQKVFDSNWFFSGQLVLCEMFGIHLPQGAGLVTKDVMFPKVINYPLHYSLIEAGSGASSPPTGVDSFGAFLRQRHSIINLIMPRKTDPAAYNQGMSMTVMPDRLRLKMFAPTSSTVTLYGIIVAMGAA